MKNTNLLVSRVFKDEIFARFSYLRATKKTEMGDGYEIIAVIDHWPRKKLRFLYRE